MVGSVRLVTAPLLARWLRLDTETLRRWRVDGFLPADRIIGGVAHYSVQSIDELLERGARNFDQAPTVAQLRARDVTLLHPQEACERLGISRDILYARVRTQRLRAVKLLEALRIELSSVETYLAAVQDQDLILRERAAHVVGVKMFRLKEWVYSGDLECVAVPYNQHLMPVTRASLLELLASLLPDWASPENWLEDRLSDNRALLSLKELQPYLGLDTKGVQAHTLMEAQQLLHLQLPGGDLKFLPASVDAMLERERPLGDLDIGRLFGVIRQSVNVWRNSGSLACNLHGHEDLELYRPCLLEILRGCLSPGIAVRGWYDWRISSDEELLTSDELARALGVRRRVVPKLAAAGIVRGVRGPDSGSAWHFAARQIRRARTRLGEVAP